MSPLIYLRETAQNIKLANRLLQLILYNPESVLLDKLESGVVTRLLEFVIMAHCDDKTTNTIIGKSINGLFGKLNLVLEKMGKANPDMCISELL